MFKFPLALSRTVLCSIAALAFIVVSAGVVRAGGPGVAPVLVPYTITAIAGNTQSSIAGYRGNGVAALNATLSGPSAIAVDSVGNVYFSDQSNALIREINAQTGIIQNIAGQAPTSCTGTLCTVSHPGCSDGVQAVGNQVGSRIDGIAVDGYGNVYFVDYNYQGAWVIFKGGAQVANFISLVDNATAPTPASVLPGYIYHIAGVAVPKAGGGCTATSGATNDNVPANTVLFHNPIGMGLDGQGNIYIQDFANGVVRVLNAQATTQTFFGVSVKPGYVASIVGCNKTYSVPCPSAVPPFGSPAGGALFSNAQESMTVDQYGNVYELDTKGATGSIYGGVAYAGGAALAHLINLESGLTATPGGWYQVINSITSLNAPTVGPQAVYANAINDLVLRPASEVVDNNGNIYMMDLHWIAIYRVDVNNMMATKLNTTPGLTIVGGTTAAPQPCAPGSIYNSTDAYGDGCPAQLSKFNSAGTGYMAFDGAGNLYVTDTGNNIVRKISVGTQFPTINTGAAVTQTVQVHFDPSNLPAVTGTSPFSTTGFKITAGANDFAVSSVSCSNYTTGIDNSLECYANVTFTPTAPGSRKGTLLVTTASGSTYPFALTGFGNGPQIAVDGGTPSKLALTGLGKATAVAHDAAGNVYIADPTNNRVVVTPAGGGAQTTVGTGLSAPQGVAVDPAGDVYISDTGNNRVVEVLALGGGQTVLTTNVSKPLGLALDTTGNLYIADNGNRRIVEISPFGSLGTAPLLSYTGSQSLVSPVGIAIDKNGNLYVADSGNSTGLIKILAGGGDLQVAPGSTSLNPQTSIVSFGTAFVTAPSGVAIDAAGNLYVADGTSNSVQVVPSASGPGSEPFALNLPGLSGPGGLDLDSAGNVYVADTGNSRVLIDNRSNVAVNFGLQAQFQPPATIPLTITNIGTTSLTPAAPFSKLSGATADFSERDTCAASNFSIGVLVSGLHCSETISFLPVVNGPLASTATVQNGSALLSITGTGQNPLVKMTLAVTSPATGPVYGSPAAITLTATQPNGSNVPSGSVTFNYTINGVAQTPITQTLTPNGSGGASTVLNLNNLLAARVYVINATYNGDAADSITNAAPLTFTVPGLPITVVANSVSYTYGGAVPALTGTVSGILPADQAGISIAFVSAATSSSPVGVYPMTVVLSGGNSASYTIPTAVTPTGAAATVTENQAPLSVVISNFNTTYGAPNISYSATQIVTGLVNGDAPQYKYTPPTSSTLPVGTYTIVPTLSIPTKTSYDNINNYKLTVTNGKLVVAQGASGLTISQTNTAVLPTALSTGSITIAAAPPAAGYYGTPTGTVVMTDAFTPITTTGVGATVNNPNVTLTLVGGMASYTPIDPSLGTHVYTFAYGGDSNFLSTNTASTPTSLIVDNADFTVVSTTSPIQIAPGVLPGGNSAIIGESAATPETATIYIAPILGSTATINLTCAVPASYITCTISPASVTLTGKTTLTSIVSVSTPATLPIDFTGQLEQPGHGSSNRVAFAAIPLAALLLLPLCAGRRRIRITRLLVLLASVALLASASGCGSNNVKFFTPVPAGPSQVVITGTSGNISRSFTVPINVQ